MASKNLVWFLIEQKTLINTLLKLPTICQVPIWKFCENFNMSRRAKDMELKVRFCRQNVFPGDVTLPLLHETGLAISYSYS